MFDIIFLFYFRFIKHSSVNKMVEDCVIPLLKNSFEIKVDQWPCGKCYKYWSSEEDWKIHCM